MGSAHCSRALSPEHQPRGALPGAAGCRGEEPWRRTAGVVLQGGKQWFEVTEDDVDVIFPGLVYWRMAEITEQYRGEESVSIAGQDLFSTSDKYFDWVVGRRPCAMIPNPAEVLYDYMRYEVKKTHQPPANYRKLAERRQKEQWPQEAANWPTDVEVGAIALYLPAAPAAQVRRREGGSGSSGGEQKHCL